MKGRNPHKYYCSFILVEKVDNYYFISRFWCVGEIGENPFFFLDAFFFSKSKKKKIHENKTIFPRKILELRFWTFYDVF